MNDSLFYLLGPCWTCHARWSAAAPTRRGTTVDSCRRYGRRTFDGGSFICAFVEAVAAGSVLTAGGQTR
jgi:hypothetical protein